VHEGSSKGITEDNYCRTVGEAQEQTAFLLKRYAQPVLVEEYLPGREFTCAVIPAKLASWFFGSGSANITDRWPNSSIASNSPGSISRTYDAPAMSSAAKGRALHARASHRTASDAASAVTRLLNLGLEPFKIAKETLRSHQAPEWLTIDAASLTGAVVAPPSRDQMPLDLNEQLVVEYYSR